MPDGALSNFPDLSGLSDMQRAILSSAAKKVAEIDEITIYGMLTTGRLICKCIDVFAYKSASTYLPLTGDMGLFRTILN